MDMTKVSEISEQCKGIKHVGIFVDFDNVYYTLKDYGINIQEPEYDIFKAINTIYSKEKIRTLRAYADYDQVDISFKWMQEHRVQIKNVYGNGREEEHRKNASDIELSIDAMESYYKNPEIDTFVFITSDSDMIPIMSRLIFKGKNVHLYYIDAHTSQYQNILEICNMKCDILDLLSIQPERGTLDYWKNNAISLMTKWYDENKSKTLGGRWLNDLFQKEFHFTSKKSSELIKHLKDNLYIEEKTNNGNKFYVVAIDNIV